MSRNSTSGREQLLDPGRLGFLDRLGQLGFRAETLSSCFLIWLNSTASLAKPLHEAHIPTFGCDSAEPQMRVEAGAFHHGRHQIR